jgi:hypothetical protein
MALSNGQAAEYMDLDDVSFWALRQGMVNRRMSTNEIAAAAGLTLSRLEEILGNFGEAKSEEVLRLMPILYPVMGEALIELLDKGDHSTPCKKQCNPANGCNHKECPYQDMFWVL